MIGVLFICLGNICRSPMAEAVFRDLVKKEQLTDKIKVDSAGTAGWHIGKVPHEGTRAKLDEKEVSYAGMKGRQVTQADFSKFDYLIAMDDQNIKDLQSTLKLADESNLAKLTDFLKSENEGYVPDPYHTGDFDYTYQLVFEGSTNLLTHIRKNHNI